MNLKKTLAHEIRLFFVYAAFLMLFFSAFTLYRWLMEPSFDEIPLHFSYNLVEALILSKIVLVGQKFHLGEKYHDKSLIIPTLYKTILFTIFVFVFTFFEDFIVGRLKGKNLGFLWEEFLEIGLRHTLAKILIMSFVFLFFFAFLELDRALGPGRLYNLFFRRTRSNS